MAVKDTLKGGVASVTLETDKQVPGILEVLQASGAYSTRDFRVQALGFV